MNCRVQQAYRYRNQSIFTMFFINLKQDLKKYVQPRASVMADLFTLPYSVYSVLLADNTQRPNSQSLIERITSTFTVLLLLVLVHSIFLLLFHSTFGAVSQYFLIAVSQYFRHCFIVFFHCCFTVFFTLFRSGLLMFPRKALPLRLSTSKGRPADTVLPCRHASPGRIMTKSGIRYQGQTRCVK